MLPTKPDVRLTGNLIGEEIQMGIDQKSLAFLQTILTDLYSDPKLAVIREYSTNAWDSHVEAAVALPIEVTTPSNLSPFFKVKDHGVGLSIDDIKTIYSQYGASTKRETNDQTGMLGLGCKSALTYTNQFTITAIKSGAKASVIVSRDANNVGVMTVVDTVTTDEPNGVEITIPINRQDIKGFQEKTMEFFKYWDKNRVLVNGQQVDELQSIYINDSIMLNRDKDYYSPHKLVMGGVTYNLQRDKYAFNSIVDYHVQIIFFVNMGEVDFTPSREELHYTNKTNAKVEELIKTLAPEIGKAIQKDFDLQTTHKEIIAQIKVWNKFVNNLSSTLTFENLRIPISIKYNESYSINNNSTNHYHNTIQERVKPLLELVMSDKIFIVVGKDSGTTLTTGQKAKLRIWAQTKHAYNSPRFFFVKDENVDDWTYALNHVQWSEILEIKIPRNPGGFAKNPSYYDHVSNGTRKEILSSDIDPKKTILWTHIKDIDDSRMHHATFWLTEHNCEIIVVAKNKEKKFHREFPNAIHYIVWVKAEIQKMFDSWDNEEKQILEFLEHQCTDYFLRFAGLDIKDEYIVRMTKVAQDIRNKKADPQITRFRSEFEKYNHMRNMINSTERFSNPVVYIRKKYPLVRDTWGLDSKHMKHVEMYINAVYETEK